MTIIQKGILFSCLMIMLLAGIVLHGCAPAIDPQLLPPAENLSAVSTGEMEELALGRTYYLQECGGCHRHRMPNEFSPRQWNVTLMYHRGRPHLTREEYEKLKKYILIVSEQTYQNN